MEITYEDFRKVDIHVGMVISVEENKKARKPALVLEIDFGDSLCIKKTSAQITEYYNESNLVGKLQTAMICSPTRLSEL